MIVSQILKEKGGEVVTARPDMTLLDVARLLREKNIGAVLIMQGKGIRGILSERDIVRALAAHGEEGLRKTAQACMTENVVTCRPGDGIDHLMQVMTSGRFRHMPVLEDGRLVGLISIGDVVKRRIEEIERESEQIREYIATA
ncbi:CBS domain-containing protein [Faunimonas sp. B44]|uniref:CBS domain-containing protein n=1 Tax=Faunimonas sp. B44 TaxID=3461493 RepID=UPI004044B402